MVVPLTPIAPGVFCTFWLPNVLRATTACTFSTSQLPKVVRTWCVLYILTWKCASRHNGVQFFISHLASWLRTRRFSEPTFRPSGAPNHWKNTVFRDFPTFSRICIFFLLTHLSSNLSLLSASSLLCFSSVHIVGSLTSKLPSTIYFLMNYPILTHTIISVLLSAVRGSATCFPVSPSTPALGEGSPINTNLVKYPIKKMQPTNPNAHTYVNGTDVETWIFSHVNNLVHFPLLTYQCTVECGILKRVVC